MAFIFLQHDPLVSVGNANDNPATFPIPTQLGSFLVTYDGGPTGPAALYAALPTPNPAWVPIGTGGSTPGLAAFGWAVNIVDQTIGGNAFVTFTPGGTGLPNVGITPPIAGGDSFTILTQGIYEFDFSVVGESDPLNPPRGLQFTLAVNGVRLIGTAYEFKSNFSNATGDLSLVTGHGLIQLSAGDTVQLVNRTGVVGGAGAMVVTSTPPGGDPGVNIQLSLSLIQAN
jgi:hypothetical protein